MAAHLQIALSKGQQSKGIRVSPQVVAKAYPGVADEELLDMIVTSMISALVEKAMASESHPISDEVRSGITIQE